MKNHIVEVNKNMDNKEKLIHSYIDKKVSKNINEEHKDSLTFGDRMADKLADYAGSWSFIFTFGFLLIVWMVINSVAFIKHFDPYPFILLNLVLSCLAAIQAPIIMMSQNRQEAKDRLRAQNDYEVNLKAELIIEDLHTKADKIIENQEKILKLLESQTQKQ
ncbi:cyclic nucleotide-binding protein [Thermoanaerobacterium sp. PSU-2]|nr:cyclic nucleotide-binding protein [Thermoanaerobacterium sp. PSU-2]